MKIIKPKAKPAKPTDKLIKDRMCELSSILIRDASTMYTTEYVNCVDEEPSHLIAFDMKKREGRFQPIAVCFDMWEHVDDALEHVHDKKRDEPCWDDFYPSYREMFSLAQAEDVYPELVCLKLNSEWSVAVHVITTKNAIFAQLYEPCLTSQWDKWHISKH